MQHNIPDTEQASFYARTSSQQLVREILRIEGIKSLNRMYKEI